MPSRALLSFEYWTCFCLLLVQVVSGGSQDYSYNPYNYDTTTPQFTPDGRLLQVEYASAAADHSSPLVVLRADGDALIFMTTRPRASPQRRLVILEDPSNFNMLGGSSESSILVAMSGVLGDNLSLLRKVSEASFERYRKFRAGLTPLQVTQTIADQCQEHAFGGGIRPFGATMMVCGVDKLNSKVNLYQTNPSGAIVYGETEDGPGNSVLWIVGGTSTEQRELHRDLKRVLDKPSSIADIMAAAARVMRSKQTSKRKNARKKANKESETDISFEIVVVSPEHGIHSLTPSQLERIESRLR